MRQYKVRWMNWFFARAQFFGTGYSFDNRPRKGEAYHEMGATTLAKSMVAHFRRGARQKLHSLPCDMFTRPWQPFSMGDAGFGAVATPHPFAQAYLGLTSSITCKEAGMNSSRSLISSPILCSVYRSIFIHENPWSHCNRLTRDTRG